MLLLAMFFLSVAASTLGAQQTAGGAQANVPFGSWSGTVAFPGGDELHEFRVGCNIDADGRVCGGFVADTALILGRYDHNTGVLELTVAGALLLLACPSLLLAFALLLLVNSLPPGYIAESIGWPFRRYSL